MRSKAIFMALLAFAFGAQAVPVSVDQARTAARAWTSRGQVFRQRLGVAVQGVAEHHTTAGAKFYAVKMSGGGTVFMSADDEVTPVIAFTASDTDFTTIDPKSPLWALLDKDISARSVVLSASSGSAQAKAAQVAWHALLVAGASSVREPGVALDGASAKDEIGDLRVDKLVKSEWDQKRAGGMNCYNYYTPKNYYCGCVATATSQLLRYVYGPSDDGGLGYAAPTMNERTFRCTVDGNPIDRTIDGTPYVWDKMKLVPAGGVTEEQCQAIGKLTSDVGATVNMSYGSGGSGAMSVKVAGSLVNVFGFKQACYVGVVYTTDKFDLTEAKLQRTMFTNFDAGYPVLLSINGQAGGHAIVADGYGYDEGLPYVHLNMGWSGSCDMWYNLPYMENAGFNVVQGVTYNAFPAAGGLSSALQVQAGILSGRVVNDDGEGIAGARITITDPSTQAAVTNLVSGEKGIWSAILPSGTYDVNAVSEDGLAVADLTNVKLTTPLSGKTEYGPYVTASSDVGNSWGNDLVLAPPAVRIDDATFSSLDKALAAVQDGDVVEILLPTELKRSCVIGVSCTIRAAEGVSATDVAVNVLKGAALSVAAGARVLFQDVAFTNTAEYVAISVAAGGTAAVSGYVGVQEFDTADADGFELAGEITTGFFLDCKGKKEANDVIGRVTATEGLDCAANIRIKNEYDPNGELGGKASGVDLIWDSVPVSDGSAVVRLVFGDGTHRNFMTFATLAKYLTPEVTAIEVCKTCGFGEQVEISKDLTITSAEGTTCTVTNLPCAKRDESAGFTISDGTLTVSNVVFCGYKGEGLFVVDGAGAGIVLDGGARLADFTGTAEYGSGAITVWNGSAKLLSGCEIRNCRSQSNGGAIMLADYSDAHLDLFGGCITGCVAAAQGGGVYVGYGATVDIRGDVAVRDNVSEEFKTSRQDNICLCDSTSSVLTLAGALTSPDRSVGVYDFFNEEMNVPGEAFALFTTDAAVAAASAPKFFCDIPYGESENVLVGELSEDGASLVWQDGGKGIDPEDANVIVIYPDTTTNYFLQVDEALASIESDAAVVELLTDGLTFTGNLVIEKDVTIRSRPDSRLTLKRVGIGAFEVRKDLTVTELIVDGGGSTGEGVLFDVKAGAALTLAAGASVVNAIRSGDYNGAGVVVDGGTLTMRDGASVSDCSNIYGSPETEMYGEGAGIWASGSTINLEGGSITRCHATAGGGAAFYDCQVNVLGGVTIQENACDSSVAGIGFAPNVLVRSENDIVLAGKFTGSVGVAGRDALGNKYDEVFGRVDAAYWPSEDASALAGAAAKFVYDDTNTVVTGCVVTNGATALLVWQSALKTDEQTGRKFYEDGDGIRYGWVDGGVPPPVIVEPDPIAFESITRISDTEWELVVTNIVPYCNYRLLWTRDLTKGFTSTGDWAQAAADAPKAWTTNVVTEGGAWFWRAEGKEGQKQ